MSATVLIRGFDKGTSEEDVRKHCASCGKVLEVQVTKRMHAYVTFANKTQADKALVTLVGSVISGNTRYIDVQACEEKPEVKGLLQTAAITQEMMYDITTFIQSKGGVVPIDHIGGKFHVQKAQIEAAGFIVSPLNEKGVITVSAEGMPQPPESQATNEGKDIAQEIKTYIESQGGSVLMDNVGGKFRVKQSQLESAGFICSEQNEKGQKTVSVSGDVTTLIASTALTASKSNSGSKSKQGSRSRQWSGGKGKGKGKGKMMQVSMDDMMQMMAMMMPMKGGGGWGKGGNRWSPY